MVKLRTRKQAAKEWRKLGLYGRLYWRANHRRWRTFFDSDDVAVWRYSTASMHFKTWQAIEDFINYNHAIDSQAITTKPEV